VGLYLAWQALLEEWRGVADVILLLLAIYRTKQPVKQILYGLLILAVICSLAIYLAIILGTKVAFRVRMQALQDGARQMG
jgi:hypothetical protein